MVDTYSQYGAVVRKSGNTIPDSYKRYGATIRQKKSDSIDKETNSEPFLQRIIKNAVGNISESVLPFNAARNIAVGLGESGQNIASTLTGGYAPRVNMEEEFGVTPDSRNPIIQGIAQSAPLLAAGPLGVAGDIAAGTAYGATQSPEDPIFGAEVAGGLSTGFGLLNRAMQAQNPILKALSRTILGATTGYAIGGERGAELGAGVGIAGPLIARRTGLINAAPKIIGMTTPEETQSSREAANRIGIAISPGEATGRPDVLAEEAFLGRKGEGATARVKIDERRMVEQKNAITDLLDTIVDKSSPEKIASSKKKISDLYTESFKWNISPDQMLSLKSDPVIEDAFNAVSRDPAYRRKLSNVDENNFAYLNQVKRAIGDMEGKAIKAGEKDRAAEFKEARDQLTNLMDTTVPAYKQAREEAQKGIIRSQIQKAMSKKHMRGTDFYNTILKNDDQFNKLRSNLSNVPDAQSKLDDMRLIFKNLINPETARGAFVNSAKSMGSARAAIQDVVDYFSEMIGTKKHAAALEYLNSNQWEKMYQSIVDSKNRNKRLADTVTMFSKILPTSVLLAKKEYDKENRD